MESLLEDMRRMHEERERLVDTMVREWMHDKKTHKEKINSEHRIKRLLDRYNDASRKLLEQYSESDGPRASELAAVSGPNEFDAFYNRLKDVKETHRQNPEEVAVPLSVEFQDINTMIDDAERVEADMVVFTDEEGYGRFIDMHALHNLFINLKHVPKVDYIKYLNEFDQFGEITMDTKKTADYRKYLDALLEYLSGFVARTCPLLDLKKESAAALESFEQQWAEGTLSGWQRDDAAAGGGALVHAGAALDVDNYSTAEELEALGLDRLKMALVALGIKCGGTAKERSERLLSTKGVPRDQWPQGIVAKAAGGKSAGGGDKAAVETKRRATAALEARICRLAEMLSDVRASTKENVQRKQARTAGELDDDEEDVTVDDVADDDDEGSDSDMPYNPKNLPLGWDGKPIPYWLYKLHGLNISYACEICGNQTYKGPKTFQRHFSEWRHSQGMRCLGIPNTSHFANITKIEDACNLWQNLREQKKNERFNPEFDEEYEDSIGNVVNKKTFEDLKRQGLL